MAEITLHIDYASTASSEMSVAGLGSDAINFGALDAYWTAISIDCDDRFETTSAFAIAPEPISRGATAKTCHGLTLAASDGERLGRLAWVPGAREGIGIV